VLARDWGGAGGSALVAICHGFRARWHKAARLTLGNWLVPPGALEHADKVGRQQDTEQQQDDSVHLA